MKNRWLRVVDGLTPDDALEGTREIDTEPKELPLKEDGSTPAASAADPQGRTVPEDHIGLDSNVETSEAYGEGVPEASEESERDPRGV